ncbi:c-type cytochrome [Acidithiobacillus sulfurivorans]|nr:c-type cytochrome [Acidithiobacillus sulfurivorans]
MMNVRNISPVMRLLVLASVVTLAAACAKKEESTTAPSDSSATSSAMSSDQGSGSTQSDDSTGSTTSPSSFDVQGGSGHFVKVAASAATMNTDQMAKAKSLAEAKGCFACHQVEVKVVGPAFAWVAYKYKGNPKAVDTLSHAIEHGVSGVWGGMPMPAQSVTPAQAKELAAWVLAQKPIAPPKSA